MRALFIAVTLLASPAQAALTPTAEPEINHVMMRHAASGCATAVVFIDGVYRAAYIVDPGCLPQGMRLRAMSAPLFDFEPQQKPTARDEAVDPTSVN